MLIGFRPGLPDAVDAVVFGHEPPMAVGPRGVRVLPVVGGLPLGMAELAPGRSGRRRCTGCGWPPTRRCCWSPTG
ncbi:hypothetical protein SVIOM342S_08696 [Streptomyces violaceorubidus]